VGSPPDDFSPKGQDWGFPPPCSEYHRENGYRLFADSIRKNCRHGGALRIDHVMRFFRLFWIPNGQDATEGTYVRERYEDLIRILALESVRNEVVIIGEDLGTVEPFVRETLSRYGILGYRLLYFEKNGQGDFKLSGEYERQALVSSSTHDLPTLEGFWVNEDVEARHRAGVLDEESYRSQLAGRAREKQKMLDALFRERLLPDSFPRAQEQVPQFAGELHNAIIGFLARTPSQLLVINQEDLTKEKQQQNLPATTWQYPNWSRKMRFTVEELRSEPPARDFTSMFRHWLEQTNRLNRKV
jgi:4-alpha-glucanotransferase